MRREVIIEVLRPESSAAGARLYRGFFFSLESLKCNMTLDFREDFIEFWP